jgi:23S rRNA (guanosine2251-2'-O)-methyltransferase
MPYPTKKKSKLKSKSNRPVSRKDVPKSALPTTKHRRNPANQIAKPSKGKVLLDKDSSQYIYGKNSVLEVLKKSPKRVQKIYITRENQVRDKRLEQILELAKESLALVQYVPIQKITGLLEKEIFEAGDYIHQGIVALITAEPLLGLDDWIDSIQAKLEQNPGGLVIALDEITDQQNIGAIIRVAETMGALGVLFPKHRGGIISPVASKVASGADKYVPLVQVGNMNTALNTLKQTGFWILGSECNPEATPFYQYDFRNLPTVLVMGSEGKGLRSSIASSCDMLGYIPMYGQIQSLNVATATAIMAYEIVTQQKTSK